MKSNAILGFLILSLALAVASLPTYVAAAKPPASDSTPVFVAEDVTEAVGCVRSVDDGPELPCPEGAVISVREMTLGEARKAGKIKHAVKTSNEKENKKLKDQLAEELHATLTPTTIQPCTASPRSITQTYSYMPSDPNATRIRFNLTYTRDPYCGVSSVKDRDQVASVGTSANGWANPPIVAWWGSCTNGTGSQCNAVNLAVDANWTAFQSQQNSQVGKRYVNIITPAIGCKTATGATCGSPYGFYDFD